MSIHHGHAVEEEVIDDVLLTVSPEFGRIVRVPDV